MTYCGSSTPLVLPSGCRAMAMVLRDGLSAREEGFCDRAYRPDGGLVPRSEPGAVLTDPEEAAGQALSLARGAVAAADGSILTLWVDTLCIHGDSPGAVATATAVRRALAEARHRRGCSRVPREPVRAGGGGAPPRRPGLPDRCGRSRRRTRPRHRPGRDHGLARELARGGLRLRDGHGGRA